MQKLVFSEILGKVFFNAKHFSEEMQNLPLLRAGKKGF